MEKKKESEELFYFMEKKQTAVEWLYVKLSTSSSDELVGNINNWFQQAKQMEKEQIHDALYTGCEIATDNVKFKHIKKIEQYYNKTYRETK
jgi:hypothetical protein